MAQQFTQGETMSAESLQGQDLNALIDQGVISPRQGGQAFEVLKNYTGGMTAAEEAASLTAGIQSPMTQEEIMAQKQSAMDVRRAQAESIFGPQIRRAEELGVAQVSTGAGVTGQRAGFNISTAEAQYIKSIEDQAETRVREIETQMSEYISTGNFQAAQLAQQQMSELRQTQNNLILKRAELAMDIGKTRTEEERWQQQFGMEQRQFDLKDTAAYYDIVKDIPAGESITVRGRTFIGIAQPNIDPFFKGSDITKLMLGLPQGVSTSIVDPNTGTTYQIEGLSTDDPNTQIIQSTSDTGEVTITTMNKSTGEMLSQISAGNIGKTKTRAASTTIIMNEKQAGMIGDAAAKLNATIGDDGFFNTDDYVKERDVFASSGGDVDTFDDTFKNRLNPSDPGATRFLTKAEVELADTGGNWTTEIEKSFIDLGISQDEINAWKEIGMSPEDFM
jgi:hypothetical protein